MKPSPVLASNSCAASFCSGVSVARSRPISSGSACQSGSGSAMSVPESTSPSMTPVLTPAASARLDFTQIIPFDAASITRALAGVMREGGAPMRRTP